jgi:hypothetical protein
MHVPAYERHTQLLHCMVCAAATQLLGSYLQMLGVVLTAAATAMTLPAARLPALLLLPSCCSCGGASLHWHASV